MLLLVSTSLTIEPSHIFWPGTDWFAITTDAHPAGVRLGFRYWRLYFDATAYYAAQWHAVVEPVEILRDTFLQIERAALHRWARILIVT